MASNPPGHTNGEARHMDTVTLFSCMLKTASARQSDSATEKNLKNSFEQKKIIRACKKRLFAKKFEGMNGG